eukprot:5353677-Prymnesium_polylepis.1
MKRDGRIPPGARARAPAACVRRRTRSRVVTVRVRGEGRAHYLLNLHSRTARLAHACTRARTHNGFCGCAAARLRPRRRPSSPHADPRALS